MQAAKDHQKAEFTVIKGKQATGKTHFLKQTAEKNGHPWPQCCRTLGHSTGPELFAELATQAVWMVDHFEAVYIDEYWCEEPGEWEVVKAYLKLLAERGYPVYIVVYYLPKTERSTYEYQVIETLHPEQDYQQL